MRARAPSGARRVGRRARAEARNRRATRKAKQNEIESAKTPELNPIFRPGPMRDPLLPGHSPSSNPLNLARFSVVPFIWAAYPRRRSEGCSIYLLVHHVARLTKPTQYWLYRLATDIDCCRAIYVADDLLLVRGRHDEESCQS